MKYMDLDKNCTFVESLPQALRQTSDDDDGTGVDLLGYEHATLVASFGAEGDTLATGLYIEVNVEESDSLSTGYSDVADADLSTSVTSTSGATGCFCLCNAVGEAAGDIYATTYLGSKRYIRATYVAGGTHSTGTIGGCLVIRHGAKTLPAT